MQVIVISYCRLKYLRQTVESLRRDDVQVCIVDGGSDEETQDFIRSNSDSSLFLENNPGADVLKTEGIKRFVTEPEFLISSDDLVYPAGYSAAILAQYRALNRNGLNWTFMACNLPYIEAAHGTQFRKVNDVEVLEVAHSQVAGAIVDAKACQSAGYFPVYGKSGQGDFAFSNRLRRRGYRVGYFRQPIIQHVGDDKWTDFPEYSAAFKADETQWGNAARRDNG